MSILSLFHISSPFLRTNCLEKKEIYENFICSVCLDLCDTPVITLCNHICCYKCMYYSLLHKRNCPICKQIIRNNNLKKISGKRKKEYEELRIKCYLCEKKMKIKNHKKHLNECEYRKCKNYILGCEYYDKKDKIKLHEELCEHRLISCSSCSNLFYFKNRVFMLTLKEKSELNMRGSYTYYSFYYNLLLNTNFNFKNYKTNINNDYHYNNYISRTINNIRSSQYSFDQIYANYNNNYNRDTTTTTTNNNNNNNNNPNQIVYNDNDNFYHNKEHFTNNNNNNNDLSFNNNINDNEKKVNVISNHLTNIPSSKINELNKNYVENNSFCKLNDNGKNHLNNTANNRKNSNHQKTNEQNKDKKNCNNGESIKCNKFNDRNDDTSSSENDNSSSEEYLNILPLRKKYNFKEKNSKDTIVIIEELFQFDNIDMSNIYLENKELFLCNKTCFTNTIKKLRQELERALLLLYFCCCIGMPIMFTLGGISYVITKGLFKFSFLITNTFINLSHKLIFKIFNI
ncbi:zinc finger protein, putative [Plasmodium gallinaceum]|uniref:Zinc finger protein, putative n=1 Tax=Plasmodium gallinaceum TaxID=5849 RepID=A0A1J1GPF5_PLAGA|nr:zinc finger protein, putative [Plasmodium gallinaceum]CRG94188.1 zinc finger protein, putative [Plasmodium gallinaceum]